MTGARWKGGRRTADEGGTREKRYRNTLIILGNACRPGGKNGATKDQTRGQAGKELTSACGCPIGMGGDYRSSQGMFLASGLDRRYNINLRMQFPDRG